MAKTIVGVFDDATGAQNAVRDLQTAGVPTNHIRLTNSSTEAKSAETSSDKGWTEKIVHFFESMFEDESDRKHADTYAEAWRRGHYIVVADVENPLATKAAEIMNRYGTVDIDQRAELWKKSGYTGRYDRSAAPYTGEQRERELAEYKQQQTESIPVVQEELAIGKQLVQRGGVRIHSYVQERPVEEIVRLREERVNVERRPASRMAEASDLAFQERTMDVTAQGEEAVVDKRARVVEEVVVGKDVSQREETIQDSVRRKDVEVEQLAGSKAKAPVTPAKSGAPAQPAPRR